MAEGPYVQGSGSGRVSLTTLFDRQHLFEPAERSAKRYWDDIQDAKDLRPGGLGLQYDVVGATGHAVGNPAEAGDYSQTRQAARVNLTTTSAQIDATVSMSAKFVESAKDDGSFYGDAEAEGMAETVLSFYDYADTILGTGYGTLQLATVAANVVTATTVVLAWDEGAYQLRPNMTVVFYTSTTKEHTAVIDDIDYVGSSAGAVIELDTPGTITAGAGVYVDDVFGHPAPNGLFSIVDNDELAPVIDGVTRADYPYLNATAIGEVDTPVDDFTETSVDELLDAITWKQNLCPTRLRLNNGLFREWKKISRNDRQFVLQGKGAVEADGGTKGETPSFYYSDKKIPFRVDRNLPARTLVAVYEPGFRRNILRKADWFSEKGGPIFDKIPADNGDGYKYAYIAAMMMDINQSCRKYNANGVRRGYKDPAAGDL